MLKFDQVNFVSKLLKIKPMHSDLLKPKTGIGGVTSDDDEESDGVGEDDFGC